MTGVRAVCNGREALGYVVAPQNASLEFKHSHDRPRGDLRGDARRYSLTGLGKGSTQLTGDRLFGQVRARYVLQP